MPKLLKRIFSFPRRQWQYFDWPLFLVLLITTGFGLATLYGSTHRLDRLDYLTARQALWWAVGLVAMCLALLIDVEEMRRFAVPIYIFAIGMLIYLLLFGATIKGAKSWMTLPGGLRFQPSEFAKVATVFILARELALTKLSELAGMSLVKFLAKIAALSCLPMLLILKQPDLGTAVVFAPVVLAMLHVAGLRPRYIVAGFAICLVLGASMYPFLKDYQKDRLIIHLNPEKDPKNRGYNIIQAKIALGSGKITGKGWGEGTQSSLGFLPEHHADFIFNSLGEQFGLVGCLAALGAFLFLLGRGLHISTLARTYFGAYMSVGLLAIFAGHVVLNVAIAVQLLPVTGLPLPFFSAGGSFLVVNYLIFGTILNVGMRRHHF